VRHKQRAVNGPETNIMEPRERVDECRLGLEEIWSADLLVMARDAEMLP
jgi:hypothetical protein